MDEICIILSLHALFILALVVSCSPNCFTLRILDDYRKRSSSSQKNRKA
ncbi:hypothetical protein WN51_11782 [Melipona quadrifasciata]|uniref:Uncharacterized protein n=1 Tax=Melipona quadrifasciata TaxID=166423 RepID=A0A0M9A502_9HYME|nr:hypothetical protein WN51_11782 [Melipona quadrifasciata]